MKYDFLKTFRLNLEYEFDYKYYFLETFRFDYEYAFDYEYDFLETFRFDYEYDFLRFGTRNVTTIFSAIFVGRTGGRPWNLTRQQFCEFLSWIRLYQKVVLVEFVLVVKHKGL